MVIEDTSTYRVPVIPQPVETHIDYVFGGDWCGIYGNGELVMEGHSLSALDVLEWVRDEHIAIESIATMQADEAWLEERGDLPKHIRDVKAKECGHGNHD